MIQLRKNPFSDTQIDISFIEGETATDLVNRALSENGYELSENVLSHFHVVINGLIVERELWHVCKIKESDTILIGPRIARGSGGQFFKQFAIIAVTVVASVLLSPAAGAGIGAALGSAAAIAAVTIGTTLLLNALIPPPGLPGAGIGGTSYEGSQMYTITSQSNNAKKFGSVPRVYGTHRIFPIIAANPYTEIEADPVSGNLVQYYYAIYDLGFGPLMVSDVRIGDTPFEDYADAVYKLVDLNKPAVSEGPWDDYLLPDFQYYKGDIERDGTQVALDKDSTNVSAQIFEYQATRSASDNVNGSNQEISLDFVCPQGLQAYAANGKTYTRNIDLQIEFAKEGTEDWKAYNDYNFVYEAEMAGGVSIFSDKGIEVPPINVSGYSNSVYTLLGTVNDNARYANITDSLRYNYTEGNISSTAFFRADLNSYGFAKGATYIILKEAQSISIVNGDTLYMGKTRIGSVVSSEPSHIPGYLKYNLDAPLSTSHVIFKISFRYARHRTWVPNPFDTSTGGNFTYGTPYLYDSRFVSTASQTDKLISRSKALGVARVSANTQNAHYATVKFKPREKAAFKVRITRKNSTSDQAYKVLDKLTLVNLSTRFDRKPILTDKRHVFLEVKVRATNQLNGSISNLSAVASSVLDVYDSVSGTWSKQVTDNPAWVFCDLITGIVNKKSLLKDRLHLPSIVEWANFCDEVPTAPPLQSFINKRFSCNFVLDFDTTLQSLITTVSNSFQASLNIVDGKYGVLIDKLKTTPVQIFTPRNSSGFSSTRSYDQNFHALKIRYIDPIKNWEVTEVVVYDQGYTEETATEFDELSTFACTNHEQAWRFGRYMLAQSRLRKEKITIEVDFEHLVCTRGDFVQITQDVMRVGGRPARVKEITGPDTVRIDDAIDTLEGVDYGYVYRGVSGIQTSSCDVIDSDEFKLYGPMPEVGDLIIVGEVGKVVFDCIVKSINPGNDLTATLELVEKADAIYSAESSDVLPDYNPQITLNVDSELATPPKVTDFVVSANTWRVSGGSYQYYIGLDWDLPIGAAFETFEVYVDNGLGYDLVNFTKRSFYEYIVDEKYLDTPHNFKILAVSSSGKKITLREAPFVTATPIKKITPPSNVKELNINITNQVIQLDWPSVPDTDLQEYLIRYTPATNNATWEASIPLLRADRNTTMATTQGRTGTYLIKAIDLNGNESTLSSKAITTIPGLFDLNIIGETNDWPLLLGEKVTCVYDDVGLTLKKLTSGGFFTNQYYSEGYYYYSSILDLGEIYTVRLQSLIEAEGFTVGDLVSSWPSLSDISAMSFAGRSDWDVETQYRTTENYNVMAEWNPMSDVGQMSEGDADNWSGPWKKFTMGDATGRVFQFRLKLVSNVPSVTPRVFNGVIRADMPDRLESYNNLICPEEGLEIVYSPAFKGPGATPNIQITQDNAQSGDYYILEDKTLNGFKITFYDVNNIAVTRQFDAAIKGYGRKAVTVI